MITLPVGVLLTAIVLFLGLEGSDLRVFLNLHSFIVVVVGSVAILFFSSPFKALKNLALSIWELGKKDLPDTLLKDALIKLSQNRQTKFDSEIHPLIAYAQELWEQGLDSDMFESLLGKRFDDLNANTSTPVSTLKNLAKYPPALGMTGTVMGMITLFANLNADNKNSIGPALALAMTATFYGLLIANMILMPLADRLQVRHMNIVVRNELVYNTLILINRNEPESIIKNNNLERKYYAQAG